MPSLCATGWATATARALLNVLLVACSVTQITACRKVEHQAETATSVASVAMHAASSGAPSPVPPTSQSMAKGETVVAEIGSDANAARITTARVSFDAGGHSGIVPGETGQVGGSKLAMQNRTAYRGLYAYFHRLHAAAVVEAATTVDHARLLARRDEFESRSAEDARYKQWQVEVMEIFQKHLRGKDYEVFGLALPPDAPRYDADRGEWVVPFPRLPNITDVLGREYIEMYLADHPGVQAQIQAGLPLMTPNTYVSPLRSEVGPEAGAPPVITVPASGDAARALKDRLQSGRAFYYLRFTADVNAAYGRNYADRISYTDASLVLRPVSVAIYTTAPDAVLGAFGRVPDVSELWFLAHPPLGRGEAPAATGGM